MTKHKVGTLSKLKVVTLFGFLAIDDDTFHPGAELQEHLIRRSNDRVVLVAVSATLRNRVAHEALAAQLSAVQISIERIRHKPLADAVVKNRVEHQLEGRTLLRPDDQAIARRRRTRAITILGLGHQEPQAG